MSDLNAVLNDAVADGDVPFVESPFIKVYERFEKTVYANV